MKKNETAPIIIFRHSLIYFYLFSSLVRSKHFPNQCRKNSSYYWGNNEHPQIAKGLTAFKQSRTNRTSRVNRSAGVINDNQVDEHKAKTNCQSCKVTSALLSIGSAKYNKHKHKCLNHFNQHTICNTKVASICAG